MPVSAHVDSVLDRFDGRDEGSSVCLTFRVYVTALVSFVLQRMTISMEGKLATSNGQSATR